MEEWREYKLRDCIDRIVDNRGKSAPTVEGGDYPLIEINSIGGYYPNYGLVRKYVDKFTYNNWFRSGHPVSGDILIPTVGTIGIISIMDDHEACIAQNVIALRINKEFSNLFIYYFLKCEKTKKVLINLDIGGVQPSIKVPHLLNLSIKIPQLSIQKKIASILKSFDDKIECNRRINDNFTLSFLLLTCFVLWLLKLRNDNLQHQSNALFKSFFIDFEPFREGEFAETELGVIPKNWKILSFGDFIVALTEKAPVDSLPEYSVTNNGIIPRDTKFNKKLSKSSSMNKVLRKNNLVFGMSREILNWGIMEDEIGGVSSAYNIYIIDEDLVNPTYLRLYMKAKISEFNSLIGTAAREGQSLDKGQLMQKKIYVPTKNVLQDFFTRYCPYTETIHNAEQESRRLSQLRDALLPRLMSGELKVKDLETIKY